MKMTLAALFLPAMMATAAHAQPGDHVALGVGLGWHNYKDPAFSSTNPSIVPEYHFGLTPHASREGLSIGLKGGIGYTNVDRNDFIGGFETHSGSLKMIPAMVGFGPSYRSGPVRIGVAVVAGPSFNNFSIDNAARVAYRERTGATLNSVKVENSVAVRPDMSLWYNFTDRVGLHSSVSYTVNRPMVRTTVDGVTSSERWNTDRWNYQAGLAYGIF
jgi:hypothetical protein